MTRGKVALVLCVFGILVGSVWWAPGILGRLALGQDPRAAFEEFLRAQARAEEQLIDPLILAGKSVVPIVIQYIDTSNGSMRRYAAVFLGNGGYKEGIPSLVRIITDDAEDSSMRGYALASLMRLDPNQGKVHAIGYIGQNDSLGEMARDLLSGEPVVFTRSYIEALLAYKR